MTTALIFIITLGVLIFVHELGHFVMARRNGIRAEEFGFGFPPRIFGVQRYVGKKMEKVAEKEEIKTEIIDIQNEDGTETVQEKITDKITEIDEITPVKRWRIIWGSRDGDSEEEANDRAEKKTNNYFAGTIYSLNWFPLGGFVRIKGENGDSADTDSFASKGAWTRIKVLAAGVIMNFVLAWFLIAIVMMIGAPEEIASEKVMPNAKIQVAGVSVDSPAQKMNLKIGDEILLEQANFKVENLEDIKSYINNNKGKEITLRVKRGKEILELKGTPRIDVAENQGALGISYSQVIMKSYPIHEAIWNSFKVVINIIGTIFSVLYTILKDLFLGNKSAGMEVAGPVGIFKLTGQVSELGLVYVLQFIALLSINLGIINAFPIPALDGGRILFILIEKIKGSPVNQKVEQAFHTVGFFLLIGLMVVITFSEIF